MHNADERFFSGWEIQHFFSDNQLPLEYAANVCLPTYGEQQQNFLASTHFSPLPSPTSAEGFAVTAGHFPYGNLHTSDAGAGTMDFSMASNPGSCQPEWPQSGISASMMYQKRASLPQIQTQCQMQPGFYCGWFRDYEPSPAFPTIPNTTQSLSPTIAHSYLNAGQHDSWMSHYLGNNQDICPSSPDWDTALSASGFLRALADYDSNSNACADPPPSIAPTDDIPVPPPVLLRSEPICGLDRQTRNSPSLCRWLTMNGSSCDRLIDTDRRSVIEHLQRAHGIKPGEEKARQACLWEGCSTILNKESLARHIMAVHLKEKVHCPECGHLFAREDSLKRHLKGGQHKASSDKNVARQPSRNRSGSQ